MNIIATYNDEAVSEAEIAVFQRRQKTRGVIFDDKHNIALLHIESKGYYNLPGGGVEKGEDTRQGLIRECREEIGCDIEITAELGRTLEYRKKHSILNESVGYIGKIRGKKGERLLVGDENEAERNCVIVWVSLTEAIRLMENTPPPERLYSQYILARDLAFLKKAQEII